MTNQEIYETILSYWNEIYTAENPTLEKCIWRSKQAKQIYEYLITYHLMSFEP